MMKVIVYFPESLGDIPAKHINKVIDICSAIDDCGILIETEKVNYIIPKGSYMEIIKDEE